MMQIAETFRWFQTEQGKKNSLVHGRDERFQNTKQMLNSQGSAKSENIFPSPCHNVLYLCLLDNIYCLIIQFWA